MLGERDTAEADLTTAPCRAMGSRPYQAYSHLEHAQLLLTRPASTDIKDARTNLAAALHRPNPRHEASGVQGRSIQLMIATRSSCRVVQRRPSRTLFGIVLRPATEQRLAAPTRPMDPTRSWRRSSARNFRDRNCDPSTCLVFTPESCAARRLPPLAQALRGCSLQRPVNRDGDPAVWQNSLRHDGYWTRRVFRALHQTNCAPHCVLHQHHGHTTRA
jgi:hypothetical protein